MEKMNLLKFRYGGMRFPCYVSCFLIFLFVATNLKAQSKTPFIPDDFEVPATLETNEYRLRMLSIDDVEMDYEAVMEAGSRMGTGTMIILDDKACPVGMIANLEKFFARESCGFCTPCREGLPWVQQILEKIESGEGDVADIAILESQSQFIGAIGNTHCAHAPGAIEPLQSGLKYFRDEFIAHIEGKACPYQVG